MTSASAKPRVLIVIPARLQSTRLPEKPLKMIHGKSLVQRVWENARRCRTATRAVVATDSPAIENHLQAFGGDVVMTAPELACGSERVLAAARALGGEDSWEIILNLQGDMPFLDPKIVDSLVQFLIERPHFSMATIAAPILDSEHFLAQNVVKVVVSARQEGLYFSRSPIPCPRGPNEAKSVIYPQSSTRVFGFKHMGLYAFTPEGLRAYDRSDRFPLGQSPLEQIEKLEQLRVLERGGRIGVMFVDPALVEHAVEVDTQQDLDRADEIARRFNN